MRQYLHKTGLLLTIFIMVSIVFNLCGAAIKHQKDPDKLLPNLSNEYVLAEKKNATDIETYLTYFEKVKKGFTWNCIRWESACSLCERYE